ncbi:MAG: hypothetical protein ACOX6E_01740 [Syntrophomonadaceae bacterium]
MANVKIERTQKNIMRNQLEEVLKKHHEINEKIDDFNKTTEVPEYQQFWQELKRTNSETIKTISRFAVRKCNR